MKFSSIPNTSVQQFVKINPTLFCCSFFFKEPLTSQVRIKKIANTHSTIYNHSPSGSTLKTSSLCSLYSGYPSMIGGIFQIYIEIEITGRRICKSKKLHIFTHAPKAKLYLQFLSLPPGRRTLHIPCSVFPKIYFPGPVERGRKLKSSHIFLSNQPV